MLAIPSCSAIFVGRWPLEYRGPLLTFHSDIRVKHLGWVRAEEHRSKYELYRAREVETRGAPWKHTESIVASLQDIKLEKWFDSKPRSAGGRVLRDHRVDGAAAGGGVVVNDGSEDRVPSRLLWEDRYMALVDRCLLARKVREP